MNGREKIAEAFSVLNGLRKEISLILLKEMSEIKSVDVSDMVADDYEFAEVYLLMEDDELSISAVNHIIYDDSGVNSRVWVETPDGRMDLRWLNIEDVFCVAYLIYDYKNYLNQRNK